MCVSQYFIQTVLISKYFFKNKNKMFTTPRVGPNQGRVTSLKDGCTYRHNLLCRVIVPYTHHISLQQAHRIYVKILDVKNETVF